MGIIEYNTAYGGPNGEYQLGVSIKLTKFGDATLENVLDIEQDILSTFIDMQYRQELGLSYTPLSSYSSSETIEKLRELISNSEIIKSQKMDIEAGLRAFQDMNYISSLKTFIPAIEGVLRNIYVVNEIGGTEKDLEQMLQELKSNKWINKETEGMIIALGRTKKAHGLENISQQEAQLYSTMALKALECLHKDYYFFSALRMSFKKIAEKEEHLTEDFLLNSYLKRKDVIHVLVREHTINSNFKEIELLCTLPKHKKIYCFKINLKKNNIEKFIERPFEEK